MSTAAPPGICPACQAPLDPHEAMCDRCGLVVATFQPSAAPPSVSAQAPAATAPTFAPAMPYQPGQALAGGRYTMQRALSAGGMGAVYLATDHHTFDRRVVIKAMREYFDPTDPHAAPTAQQRFLEEARILAHLRHPAIPQIYAYFQDGAHNFIVMEYIEGRDLQHGLTSYDETTGQPIPGSAYAADEVVRWGVQLCQVLDYLANRQPRPVVHHDIKPANLLLDHTSGATVRLVDFGTAKARLLQQPGGKVGLQQSSLYGTQGYAPPEQYRGESEPRSDVYALAATLYHLATDDDPGLHPFTFPQLDRLDALGRILHDALNPNVTQRPTAAMLGRSLDILQIGAGGARRAPPTQSRATPLQAPDGSSIADVRELAQWCEAHWDLARIWLYSTLPNQIDALWPPWIVKSLRDICRRHADNRDAGVDSLLRLLDWQFPAPQVTINPTQLEYGTLSLTKPPTLDFTVTNSGRGYAVLTIHPGHWLTAQPLALNLQPGQTATVALGVALDARNMGGRLITSVRLTAAHGLTLLVPVSATFVVHAPDGSQLADLGALVAWCVQHWNQAKDWLYRLQSDNLPAQIERWGYTHIAGEVRKLTAQKHISRDEGLDQALALLDSHGYGAEPQHITADTTALVVDPRQTHHATLKLTNSGRRYKQVTVECPPWITINGSPTTTLALRAGAQHSALVQLDRTRLPLRAGRAGTIRIHDHNRDLFQIQVDVPASIWRKIRWRYAWIGRLIPLIAIALGVGLGIWEGIQQQPFNACRNALRYRVVQHYEHLPEDCLRAQPIERSYLAGIAAFERGDWNEAQQQFEAVVELSATYKDAEQLLSESYVHSATAAADAQQWDEAAATLTKLQQIAPDYGPAQDLIREHRELDDTLQHQARMARLSRWVQQEHEDFFLAPYPLSGAQAEQKRMVTMAYCAGLKASADGEWAIAQRQYEYILNTLPPNHTFQETKRLLSESYYWDGVEDLQRGNQRTAQQQFEAAVLIDPQYQERVQHWSDPNHQEQAVTKRGSELAQKLQGWVVCSGWSGVTKSP